MFAFPAKNSDLKFSHNTQFDSEFDQVDELIWYPYVGKQFGQNGTRIIVYGHNAYIDSQNYENTKTAWIADKAGWANCIEEYAYEQKWYTEAFRFFIKGAVGLESNFGIDSEAPILARVDSFIDRIAWINFIQDAVKSDNALAAAEAEQVERSKRINREILRILGITHCICWGKPTYEYVRSMVGFKIVSEKNEGKSGFASCVIDTGDGHAIRCLRIYHPSMPGFSPFSNATHSIISGFLETARIEGSHLV